MAARRPRSSMVTSATLQLIYRVFAPAAVASFIAAVMTDFAYASTASIIYAHASAWLLVVGLLLLGVVIAIVALSLMVGWLGTASNRGTLGMFAVAFVVETFNVMIHNRDGWTSVVPTGMTLSVAGALLLLVPAWMGRAPLAPRRA